MQENKADARTRIAQLKRQYYAATDEATRRRLRNELVGEAMQAINAQYGYYEASLTRDRQRIGFLAEATSIGLNTAGTLTPAGTANILSGLAGAVTGIKGQYEKEIIFSKAVDIIATEMRASRAIVGKRLIERMSLSTTIYPLPLAEADLEDYYLAGTLNSGLMKASASAGEDARAAEASKEAAIVGKFAPDDASATLKSFLMVNGEYSFEREAILEEILRKDLGVDRELWTILDRAEDSDLRKKLVAKAREKKVQL